MRETVLALVVLAGDLAVDLLVGLAWWQWLGGTVLTVAALLLRARFPVAVLLVCTLAVGTPTGSVLLLVIVGWTVGRRIDSARRALAAFAGSAAVSTGPMPVVVLLLGDADGTSYPLLVGVGMGVFVVCVGLPGLAGRYQAQRRALIDAIREREARLVRERALVAREAVHRERTRIAQDMHDSLGHRLVLISVHAGGLEVDPDLTDRQRRAAQMLRSAAGDAMGELREVVAILRDEGAATPVAAPFATMAGIETLVAESAAHASILLERSGEERPLAPAAGHTAYRAVQEGLTNMLKHAPGADARVALRYEPDALVVEIHNGPPSTPGAGADAISGGRGLSGLGERARLVGGMAHAGPTGDGGFRLAVVLPYVREKSHNGASDAESTFVAHTLGDARSGHAQPHPTAQDLDPDPSHDRDDGAEVRAAARAKRRYTLGCLGVALVLVAAVVGFVVWGLTTVADEVRKSAISPQTYDAIEVGRPEAEVRELLPEGSGSADRAIARHAPPEPPGADCAYFTSSARPRSTTGVETAYRFCFANGSLVNKRAFEVTP